MTPLNPNSHNGNGNVAVTDARPIPRGSRASKSLLSRQSALASTERQRSLLSSLQINGACFENSIAAAGFHGLYPAQLEIFQINLGKLCNMTCKHCHVDAGPDRTDAVMSRETIEQCLVALDKTTATTIDLTGGAPELHPDFRYLVEQAVARGKHVIDRCNLTVLLLDRFKGLAAWLAERGVEIVASLPHYRQRNTDAQRGDGTFEQSIRALRLLNACGYGQGDPKRRLTLMSNPAGAFLAGDQSLLETEWKDRLKADFGITFDRLFVLNNMPISRFLEWLADSGNLEPYMQRLIHAFNPQAVAGLMCRNTISISWDGKIYDCDFNQMLDLEARMAGVPSMHIRDFEPGAFARRRIVTARHCYGCTAGCGTGCGGKTT